LKQSNKLLVVADTGPLIALSIMDLLPQLHELFAEVYVPNAVVDECLHDLTKTKSTAIKNALDQGYIKQKKVENTEYCRLLAQILDQGEAEAIGLAIELGAIALIDEKAGRKVAQREAVTCIGSLYVLVRAKQAGRIKSATVLLNRLVKQGYYLDKNLIKQVQKACNE